MLLKDREKLSVQSSSILKLILFRRSGYTNHKTCQLAGAILFTKLKNALVG